MPSVSATEAGLQVVSRAPGSKTRSLMDSSRVPSPKRALRITSFGFSRLPHGCAWWTVIRSSLLTSTGFSPMRPGSSLLLARALSLLRISFQHASSGLVYSSCLSALRHDAQRQSSLDCLGALRQPLACAGPPVLLISFQHASSGLVHKILFSLCRATTRTNWTCTTAI